MNPLSKEVCKQIRRKSNIQDEAFCDRDGVLESGEGEEYDRECGNYLDQCNSELLNCLPDGDIFHESKFYPSNPIL